MALGTTMNRESNSFFLKRFDPFEKLFNKYSRYLCINSSLFSQVDVNIQHRDVYSWQKQKKTVLGSRCFDL